MDEANCPNCGATKRGAVCAYCGTHFGRYQGQATVEVEHDVVCIREWGGDVVYKLYRGSNTNITIIEEA